MINFILGVIFGIMIATAGPNGISKILNNGVESIQTHTKELTK